MNWPSSDIDFQGKNYSFKAEQTQKWPSLHGHELIITIMSINTDQTLILRAKYYAENFLYLHFNFFI